jgi:hypothetical protein
MIDYILKFPSKEAAEQFGLASGFAVQDEKGNIVSTIASHEHALYEIGEHFITQQTDIADESETESVIEPPIPIGDGQYWVLFRDLVGIPVPPGAEEFIVWSSNQTTYDDNGYEISVPRLVEDSSIPNVWWC